MVTHNSMLDVFIGAAQETTTNLDFQIIRSSGDMFRRAQWRIGDIAFQEGSILTRENIAKELMKDFHKNGITAITYSNGRQMPIDSYSEMAGRTMAGNTAAQASLNRYREYGFDLIKISAHFQTCPLCAPWENKVVSVAGYNPKYPALSDAISSGYGHPNCIHTFSPWKEGFPITEVRLDPHVKRLVDKHGRKKAQEIVYKAQQRQRAIERKIRNWKVKNATTLDPTYRAQSGLKIKQWQAAQRQHLLDNPFLRRDYAREGIRVALPRRVDPKWLQFKNDAAVREYFAKHPLNVTPAEAKSIKRYTDLSGRPGGYKAVNDNLRGLKHKTTMAENQPHIDNMLSALEKNRLPEDMVLHRGTSLPEVNQFLKASGGSDESLVGAVFREKGFVSTTPSTRTEFIGMHKLHINAPKGTKGIFVDTISKHADELEILLSPGTKYRVDRVYRHSSMSALDLFVTII